MTTARTKKMTDPLYFPTTPANETQVRSLHDDMYQEIFDNLNIGKAEDTAFQTHRTSNDHDGRYYTEAEINALLSAITVAGLSPDSITDAYLKQTGSNILPNFNTHLADKAQAHDIDIIRLAKTATGSVNAFAVDTSGTFDLTKNGNILNFIPNLTTTSTTPTIAVDGQTAKNIKKADDTGTMVALVIGDIKKNVPTTLVWDSVNDFFILAPKSGGSNIKSLQRGIASIASSGSFIDVTITSVDTSKSIIKITPSCASATIVGNFIATAVFINATTIRIERATTPAIVVPYTWEVIEFNNVKSKQTGTKTISHNGTYQTVNSTVTSVDTSKSTVFATWKNTTATDSSPYAVLDINLTSSTNISFGQRGSGGITTTIEWQLIEFN